MELELTNFKVDSSDWGRNKFGHKCNESEDIVEDRYGIQFFTYEAAMRETHKANKIIPSFDDWKQIIGECTSEQLMERFNITLDGIYKYNEFNSQGYSVWLFTSTDFNNEVIICHINHNFDVSPEPYMSFLNKHPNAYYIVRCLKTNNE